MVWVCIVKRKYKKINFFCKKMLTIEEWYGIISLVADEDDKNLKKFLRKIKKVLDKQLHLW